MTELMGSKYPVLVRFEEAPATGSTVAFQNPYNWLVLTAGSTTAALTVTLPPSPVDGQIALISNFSIVTSMTFSPAVSGFTNTNALAAGQGIELAYSSTVPGWFVLSS